MLRIKGIEIAEAARVTPAYVCRYLNGVDNDGRKRIRPVLAALIITKEKALWGEKPALRLRKALAWAMDLDISEIPNDNHKPAKHTAGKRAA